MKYKSKKLAILRCKKCKTMNELSEVEHGDDFHVSFAIVECSNTGKIWEFGKRRRDK